MRAALLFALLLPIAAHAGDTGPIGPGEGVVDEGPEEGRVWVYIDSGGQLHFVDRLELVPSQYRSQARQTSLVTTQEDRDSSANKAAQKRRDARVSAAQEARKREMEARIRAREEAEKRATEAPSEADAPPSRAEQLAEALTERRAILEELVALDEGYSDDPEQSEEGLVARMNALDKRLADLDSAIARLERGR